MPRQPLLAFALLNATFARWALLKVQYLLQVVLYNDLDFELVCPSS